MKNTLSEIIRWFPLFFTNREETWSTDVHALPDAGAGEGVPFQSVSDSTEKDRDRACALFDGAANQDLVPEPSHEMEKGKQDQRGTGFGWRR